MKITARILLALALCSTFLSMAGSAAAQSASDVQRRLDELEQENRRLRNQLDRQQREIESLKQSVQKLNATSQNVPAIQRQVPELKSQIAALQQKRRELPFDVGFRTGWAESPYDLPGGFFWGFYGGRELLTQDDGIPGGIISAELMGGVIQGNHTNAFGASSPTPFLARDIAPPGTFIGPSRFRFGSAAFVSSGHQWANTIEIEPTIRYALELPGLRALDPYALVGPSMFLTIFQGSGSRTKWDRGPRFV
jgi:cell division protein FtsB